MVIVFEFLFIVKVSELWLSLVVLSIVLERLSRLVFALIVGIGFEVV